MAGTWWLGEDDLDEYQKAVITLGLGGSHFVTGPPGSGKTNLLLLRAKYHYLANERNIAIVLFTRTLREFIASGGHCYGFPDAKIQTCRAFQQNLLREYGVQFPPDGDFKETRLSYIRAMSELIDRERLSDVFDCVLLDEAQDYLPEEIHIFNILGRSLFCVADSRQKIYEGADSIDELRKIIGTPHGLRFHYRNGTKICKVADGIMSGKDSHELLLETSNYDEEANPSSVELVRCQSLEKQADCIIAKLDAQLKAYTDELIGIVCPKREEVEYLWSRINASEFAEKAVLQKGKNRETFESTTRICVCTIHAAKGLEFRSLHIAACESLSKFARNRSMCFTAITRAKTSLSLYYGGQIRGYLESAFAHLDPPTKPPTLKDVFKGN